MTLTDVRAALLAGGLGSRMEHLTAELCKPLVPYAASCRLVDFSVANTVRSGVGEMVVLSLHRERELLAHLMRHWEGKGTRLNFGPHDASMRAPSGPPAVLPPRPRELGTADALVNNAPFLFAPGARDILILHADHVYSFDYGPMVAAHRASGADATLGVQRIDRRFVHLFGMVDTAPDGRVRALVEKPSEPTSDLVFTAFCLFRAEVLRDVLDALATRPPDEWQHDISRDVVPFMITAGMTVLAHAVEPYWADVGTADRYVSEQLRLVGRPVPLPPASLPVTLAAGPPSLDHRARALIGHGARIDPTAVVRSSVLFPGATVESGAWVEQTIVLPGARVPAGARVHSQVVTVDPPGLSAAPSPPEPDGTPVRAGGGDQQ